MVQDKDFEDHLYNSFKGMEFYYKCLWQIISYGKNADSIMVQESLFNWK